MHLIEHTTDGARAFMSLKEGKRTGNRIAWVGETEKALQFVRREDAQDFIETYFPNMALELTVAEVRT